LSGLTPWLLRNRARCNEDQFGLAFWTP